MHKTPLKLWYIGSKQRFIYKWLQKSSKICINCQSKNTQNRGSRRGIKRYFCKDCKRSLGTLVFKDNESKEILIWKHIESEIVKDYRYLKEELIALGYTIQSATLDGKRGLYKAFKDIPIQMCHFHQKKSVSSTTGELHYTHPRIRAAYRSLRTNLPYLFTYKNYKYLSNALEGGVFSHMTRYPLRVKTWLVYIVV